MRDREWEKSDFKVFGNVFGRKTLMALYKLLNKGVISHMEGEIFSGKEANIFLAAKEDEPRIVKIYRIESADFNNMAPYIAGDPRFELQPTKRKMVYEWTKKEYKNLLRFTKAGVRVPLPYDFLENILIMEFIGDERPALPMKRKKPKYPQKTYDKILEYLRLAVTKARLVHADLSEYNILNFKEEPVIIDCGQSVDIKHPEAEKFFDRDLKNLNRFFRGRCSTKEMEWAELTGGN